MSELRKVAKFVPTMYDGIGHLEALSDSDFANDKDTGIIVYRFIKLFCGIPIA